MPWSKAESCERRLHVIYDPDRIEYPGPCCLIVFTKKSVGGKGGEGGGQPLYRCQATRLLGCTTGPAGMLAENGGPRVPKDEGQRLSLNQGGGGFGDKTLKRGACRCGRIGPIRGCCHYETVQPMTTAASSRQVSQPLETRIRRCSSLLVP